MTVAHTSYTASVTINNVAPTTSNLISTYDPASHIAVATFDFADVGTADTHAGSLLRLDDRPASIKPSPAGVVEDPMAQVRRRAS